MPTTTNSNSEKKYWFTAKRFGYGWYPASWQGWSVLGFYLAYFTIKVVDFIKDMSEAAAEPKGEIIGVYLLDILVATVFLIVIAYLSGEKPRWRWGI